MSVSEVKLSFKPGDVIQDYCDPFAKILFDRYKGQRCDNCFKRNGTLNRCNNCKLMWYCDKACQLKDWKEAHKFECKSEYFKKPIDNPLQPSDTKRQVCRLLGLLKLHPELGQKKFPMYDGTDRMFDDLMAHQSELKRNVGLSLFCRKMATELVAEGNFVNTEEGLDYLLRLVGIWQTNAFSILNETETETIGSAIFIEPSVFDHSCKPNAITQTQGCRMQIRAIGPIAEGKKPYVTYLAGHKTRQERFVVLKERYNFECKCERCNLEETESLVDYDRLKSLITLASNQYNWKDYLKTHEEILELMRNLYHEYDERISNRCFLTFQEAGPLALRAPVNIVRKLAKSAEEHLRITFGTDSPDYKKCVEMM